MFAVGNDTPDEFCDMGAYEFDPFALDKGTHDWQEYSLPFTTTLDYDFIKVIPVISELQSGTVYIDSVTLVKN